MIIMKLATAGLLGLVAASALTQAPSLDRVAVQAVLNHGDRDPLPRSNQASNIVSADISGTNVPALPSPALSLDAPSLAYSHAARASLGAGHTGQAK
jgi:hypothetical protein